MSKFEGKFVNPFTDYGFKRIFGEEANKDILIDFLNELLEKEQGKIVDLTYLKTEQLGIIEDDRRAVFDLYCKNEKGERFIVELQKTAQDFFKDRTIYYATFPIQEQADKGKWNYELNSVYTIAILDFVFKDHKQDMNKFRHDIKLMDTETHEVFYDKLTFIYLEMPKYTKSIDELETHFDKWLYLLRNLSILHDIPERFRDKIFSKLFETAEIAKFTNEQVMEYEDSLKRYRDLKNSLDTAKRMGREEGKEEGIEIGIEKGKEIGREEGIEIGLEKGIEKGREETMRLVASGLKEQGMPTEAIAIVTKLTLEEIEKL